MDPPLKSPASAQRDTSPSPPVPNRIRRNTACTSCRDSKVGAHPLSLVSIKQSRALAGAFSGY
ncbi:hypothetical protein ColLi_03545 [Colletotrichum liriopes]|uniref:Uncharacterized protein n=1 Tax=Colletotrichum liriopes TaxID=708192 RepID=A0AA37GHB9_9PEZI|nr:hypothetical protein ColLi_03545 [Colletotrichum liriopes]